MSERSMIRARRRRDASRRRRAAVVVGLAAGFAAGGAPVAGAADFPVTNANPNGPGSLRAAVTAANGNPGPDTVTFLSSFWGTIPTESDDIEITDSVAIRGPEAGSATVDGGGGDRIFDIHDLGPVQPAVTIDGLSLVDGGATGPGGAIRNYAGSGSAANLIVRDCVLTGSEAADRGGAIYSDGGALTVADTLISGNRATGGASYGGGIHVQDTRGTGNTEVTLSHSTLSGNFASADGGGGHLGSLDGDLYIESSTISGNGAGGDGGGLSMNSASQGAAIRLSTLSGNTAGGSGGGFWLFGAGEPTLVSDSTIAHNSAGHGAGIASYQANDAPLSIQNSTVAQNAATQAGGGIYREGADDPARPGEDDLTLSSTIVATNTAPSGPDISDSVVGPPSTGSFTAGFSLIGDPAGNVALVSDPGGTNLLNVSPELSPLGDYGGPTRTMLPAETSPAVDHGVANGLAVDQRGQPRTVKRSFEPISDGTDIGAVELGDPQVDQPVLKAKRKQRQRGREVKVKLTVSAREEVIVEASGKLKVGPKRFALRRFSRMSNAGRRTLITLNPKGASADRQTLKRLARGRTATARLRVDFTDPAGNETTKKRKVELVGKKGKKQRR